MSGGELTCIAPLASGGFLVVCRQAYGAGDSKKALLATFGFNGVVQTKANLTMQYDQVRVLGIVLHAWRRAQPQALPIHGLMLGVRERPQGGRCARGNCVFIPIIHGGISSC